MVDLAEVFSTIQMAGSQTFETSPTGSVSTA